MLTVSVFKIYLPSLGIGLLWEHKIRFRDIMFACLAKNILKKIHHLKSKQMRNLCAFFAETGSISIDKWQNCLAVSELRKSADSRSYYFLPRMDAGGGFSFSAEFDMLQLLEKELIYVDNRNYVSYLPSSLLKKERSGVASDVDKIKILSADSLSSEVADLLFGETPTLSLESGKDVSVYSIISDVMPSERYVASVYNSNIKKCV